MKIPTHPFPTSKPAHGTDHQRRERKAKKRLEALNYTSQTAGHLARILRALAREPDTQRKAVLRAFTEISSPTFGK